MAGGKRAQPRDGSDPPPRGFTAVPCVVSEQTLVDKYTGYLQDLLPLHALQSSVKLLAKEVQRARDPQQQPQQQNAQDGARLKVRWVRFDSGDSFGGDSQRHQYLLVSAGDAVTVWDVNRLDDVHEVLSIDAGAVACAKVFPRPRERHASAPDKFADVRPLMALAVDTSQPDAAAAAAAPAVMVYSMRSRDVVRQLPCKERVTGILASARLVVVAGETTVTAYSPGSLETAFRISGCRIPGGVHPPAVALGPRWLAYATTQHSKSHGRTSAAPSNGAQPPNTAVDIAKDYAKDLASGLYYVGGKGYQTVSQYLSRTPPDASKLASSPERDDADGQQERISGVVVVRDVETRAVIALFQAHRTHAISNMAFDSNGTLLATVSSQGRTFHIFSLTAANADSAARGGVSAKSRPLLVARHLYKLNRGMTNAVIQDISFSQDSRWVAFSTSNATTHIFAINPWGGPPTVHTHVTPSIPNLKVYASAGAEGMHTSRPLNVESLAALVRLRQQPVTLTNQSLEDDVFPVSVQFRQARPATSVAGPGIVGESLLVANHKGLLLNYLLEPQPAKSGGVSADLDANVLPIVEWDLINRPAVGEAAEENDDGDGADVKAIPTMRPVKAIPVDSQPPRVARPLVAGGAAGSWLPYVELKTHLAFRPLFHGPQFTFRGTRKGERSSGGGGRAHETPRYEAAMTDSIFVSDGEPVRVDANVERDSTGEATVQPRMSQDDLIEHLTSAMETELEIPQTPLRAVHQSSVETASAQPSAEYGPGAEVDLTMDVMFFQEMDGLPDYPRGGTIESVGDDDWEAAPEGPEHEHPGAEGGGEDAEYDDFPEYNIPARPVPAWKK